MGRKTKENPAHRSFLEKRKTNPLIFGKKRENQSHRSFLEKRKTNPLIFGKRENRSFNFWKKGKPIKVIAAATKDLCG